MSQTKILHLLNPGLKILLLLLLAGSSGIACANQYDDKSPTDTYRLTVQLADAVKTLRQQNGVRSAWPDVVVHGAKGSRLEYQKALEVLAKINRYRQIHKLGLVSTPAYPSREVTPNEVFDFVQRLVGEVDVLIVQDGISPSEPQTRPEFEPSRTINYRQLWKISKALDPLLGVRGFSPGDVFAQSENIVALVHFLRITQNIPDMPDKPRKGKGKHPNHALAAAYQLLDKISIAEHNLWMQPIQVPEMEKRVISPTEVYDALQTTIAELQRIKFRIGVERPLKHIPVDARKTPDDVIQDLQWAAMAMPQFTLGKPLRQFNPASLKKTPDDVFRIAKHLLWKLRQYKKMRGIEVKAVVVPSVSGLKPHHVYQKTLECLKKIAALRKQSGLGASAIPLLPMRPITPNDVFILVSRLNNELDIIFQKSEMPLRHVAAEVVDGKTPSDVFHVMWQISYELDTILGSQGQTPNDVFQMVQYLEKHIRLFGSHLGYNLKGTMPAFKAGLQSKDVIVKARDILKCIGDIKRRANIFSDAMPTPVQNGKITPNDVFNLVGMLGSEFTEIEISFGISEQLSLPPEMHDKTPSDVYQQLGFVDSLLNELLGEADHE